MSVREYIGARYVPIIADPIQWDSTNSYEPLTIVTNLGNSYTSRTFVPVGIDIGNTDYWALTGNYNSQIEQYRQEVQAFADDIEANADAIEATSDVIPASAFTSSNTVKDYIDDVNGDLVAEVSARESAINGVNSAISVINNKINDIAFGDIVLIGDSYGAGYTPDGNVTGWTDRIEAFFANSAVNVYSLNGGGAGFAHGNSTFAELLTTLSDSMTAEQRSKVSTIICAGGYNDRQETYSEIRQGVEAYHAVCVSKFPNAYRIIASFVGATVTGLASGSHAGATSTSVMTAFNNWLTAAQTYNDTVAVDNGLSVLSQNNYFSSDYVHPNDTGQRMIFQHIVSLIAGTPNNNQYRSTASVALIENANWQSTANATFTFNKHDDIDNMIPVNTSGSWKFTPKNTVTLTNGAFTVEGYVTPYAQLKHAEFELIRPAIVHTASEYVTVPARVRFTNDESGTKITVNFAATNPAGNNFLSGNISNATLYW